MNGQVDLVDKRRSATLLSGELESANGTYGAGCTNRTGAWSVEIGVGAVLDNPVLSVLLDDTACVLTLTELQTSAGGAVVALPAIVLTTDYNVTPSEFGVPVDFYANASMDSVSFADDFVITILYSDDPTLVDGDAAATFEVVQSTATGSAVDAPDYAIDTSGLIITTNVAQVVQSATGSVTFTPGATAGQTYVVVAASGLTAYDGLDSAYDLGTPVAFGAVPAATFALVGEDLDAAAVIRTIIVANIDEGVAAYQAFEITFNPAV